MVRDTMQILQLLLAVSIVIITFFFHLPTCTHCYMKKPTSIRGIEMRIEKKRLTICSGKYYYLEITGLITFALWEDFCFINS